MRLKAATISGLLIFFLASCATSGDFCAVYQPVPPFPEEVAQTVVAKARASAVAVAANEVYYGRACRVSG